MDLLSIERENVCACFWEQEEGELSAGALVVRELGLERSREGGPGLPARKREGVGFPGRGTAAVSRGLPTAQLGL